ncbi:hypothetical protein D3C80_1207940 [compost metagenome]
MQALEGEGAENRPEQAAHAAENHHHQDMRRHLPAQLAGADEAVLGGRKHAGVTGNGAGDDEGRQLVEQRIEAHGTHPLFVLLDAQQHPAKGRAQEGAQQDEQQRQRGQHHIEQGGAVLQVEQLHPGDGHLGLHEQVGTVRTAGEGSIMEQVIEHLREGDGHHDEEDPRGADDQYPHQ